MPHRLILHPSFPFRLDLTVSVLPRHRRDQSVCRTGDNRGTALDASSAEAADRGQTSKFLWLDVRESGFVEQQASPGTFTSDVDLRFSRLLLNAVASYICIEQ
jgi:hypothetical protein